MEKLNKNEIAEKIINDQQVRRALTQKSLPWFIRIFLNKYLEYEFAPFQEEMMSLAEDDTNRLLSVMAFRNSGKSTLLNLGLVLWSVLGVIQKKCVVIISKTQIQAKSHFSNIKVQLETNKLLVSDMGPFRSEENAWGMYSLELPQFDAKIISISREQSIRGIRYNEYRPDLIICDDVEDTGSVEKETERDDIYHWFMSEVIPTGSDKTKIIVLGNLLHENSLLMKLKNYATENPKTSIFRAYPLLDEENKILWPQKFNQEKVQTLSKTVTWSAWTKEYLLKIVPRMTIVLDDFFETEDGEFLLKESYRQKALIKKMQKSQINCPYIRTIGVIRAKKPVS